MEPQETIIATYGIVLFNEQGEALLVEHLEGAGHVTGTIGLPAGRPEKGEMPIDTAVRELKEETGFVIGKEDLIENPETYTANIERKGGTKTFSLNVFGAVVEKQDLQESNETRPIWIKPTELKDKKLLPNVLAAVEDMANILEVQT